MVLLRALLLLPLITTVSIASARTTAPAATPIRIGAVFPLQGSLSPLARQEYRGVQIARDMVNAAGGVGGRRIVLVTQELHDPNAASSAMQTLKRRGITTVVGAYSSALSIPASAAAASRGMVYWEAGAVADRLTGRGLPTVFRVGASGSNLGANSAHFAAAQLAPRLHLNPRQLRITVVHAQDDYAVSVARAAVSRAHAAGMQVVADVPYNTYAPDWPAVIRAVRTSHPHILILASHIPDGVAFRKAFLAAHLHVDAFIGSTMAQCVPEFGALLGRDAVGVFASDRPGEGFNPNGLQPAARALYDRFAAAWRKGGGSPLAVDEGLAGFTAAWVLFHDVLPRATRNGGLGAAAVTTAARSTTLPTGSLPNGAGLRFATDRVHLGQNLRAAAVIWQWQGIRHSVVVWPSMYASGTITMVPLPR